MTRTAASLAILALGLAACASNAPSTPTTIAPNELAYRAGQGIVIAAMPARAPISAAAGGTATAAGTPPATQRLEVRMDDGSLQYVDVDTSDIPVGTRVQLGGDHTIRRL
jgi:hypothetical protein